MTPRVSVIVPAYNLARYLAAALDSALAQDWPREALEVIVVDDGSTDETPSVLTAYGDRIRVLRQDNGGLVSAVDRGMGEAGGEYLALLDADDEWPPDRVRRQVEFLQAHPAVGLVHGDMEVIDENGATIAPSFFAQQGHQPARGRVLGALLGGNFISGGASMWRASLLAALHPIPRDAAYPDWWLAANVAAVAEIDHLPGVFNRYRFHGANMGLGAGPEQIDGILRGEIPWRRWMGRNLLHDSSVSAHHLQAAFRAWEYGLLRAANADGSATAGARALVDVDDGGRKAARELGDAGIAALAGGDPLGASRLLLGGLAEDPWDGAIRFDLERALALAQGAPAPALEDPLCISLLSARERVTLAWTAELVADAGLLEAYVGVVDGSDPATLVALTRSGEDVDALVRLVADLGLDGEDAADIVAIAEPGTLPARLLLATRASAVLGPAPQGFSLPAHAACAAIAAPAVGIGTAATAVAS
jgi:glycosyltransferase involved in cell wall biosynthesis